MLLGQNKSAKKIARIQNVWHEDIVVVGVPAVPVEGLHSGPSDPHTGFTPDTLLVFFVRAP